jgi:hypothetical protein
MTAAYMGLSDRITLGSERIIGDRATAYACLLRVYNLRQPGACTKILVERELA